MASRLLPPVCCAECDHMRRTPRGVPDVCDVNWMECDRDTEKRHGCLYYEHEAADRQIRRDSDTRWNHC